MEKVFSLVRPNIFLLCVVTLRKSHSQKELENHRDFINLAVSPTWDHCRPQKSFKIGALTDFAEFTVKHLCRSHFFNKFTDLQPDVLSCDNLAKFLRITFSLEQLWATTSPHVWAGSLKALEHKILWSICDFNYLKTIETNFLLLLITMSNSALPYSNSCKTSKIDSF